MGTEASEPAPVDRIVATVREWPEVTVGPHRFDAVEFLLDGYEIGHVHRGSGALDVNYPRRIRDALVAEGRTDEHHFVPDSGWTTYRVRTGADVDGGLWLLRVAYLYRALTRRRSAVGQSVLDAVDVAAELDDLGVTDRVRAVFENVVEVNSVSGGRREER